MVVTRIGIVAKIRLHSVASHLVEIGAWLDERGIEPVFETDTAALAGLPPGRRRATREELPALVDLLLVLGGDGTLLTMADRVAESGCDIPILGVNFGHLGFLTDLAWPELFDALEAVLAGNVHIDTRLILQAAVCRAGEVITRRMALNDVVITRGALSRVIELSVTVGGEFVARFNGDGLIIASPTGSTAYNLSAGGPIIHPAVDALVLTPIAPHTLSNRPVVIPASAEVHVQPFVAEPSEEAIVTLDGQRGVRLDPGDTVTVSRSPSPVRLVHATSHSYFEVLRKKLKWAER